MSKQSNIPQLRFKEFDGKWEDTLLDNVATFRKGKGISKSDIVENGNLECIRYGELYTIYNELILNVVSKTNLVAKNLELSEYNDVIIPASGETQLDIATASCVLKSGVALGGDLNIIRSSMNGIFLSYYLNNSKKIEIAKLAQGKSVVHLYSSQLKNLKLNIPILPEQEKIASFLSAVDEKIQQLTRKAALLEQYKKGVMQQLFSGKLRFKDENGEEYPDWEEKKLGEVVEKDRKIRYGIVQPGNYDPNGRFMIRGQDYSSVKGWANSSSFFKVSEEVEQKYKKARVKSGDLLITIVGAGTGWLEVVPDFLEGANITQTTGRIAINKSVANPRYVKNYFFSYNGRKEINNYIKGQAQPGLNIGDVEIFKLPLPCLAEQQKIAGFLSGIDEKIGVVQGELLKMQGFKKGLLQQMFV